MTPENEMGVVVLFSQQITNLPIELVSIGADFPDAMIRIDDKEYRVEFEYRSSNFADHGHNPTKCDIVVCWENDLDEYVLPVWALSEAGWFSGQPELPSDDRRELVYWKTRALKAERRAKAFNNRLEEIAEKEAAKGRITCDVCGREFEHQNGLNAHKGYCKRSEATAEQQPAKLNGNGAH